MVARVVVSRARSPEAAAVVKRVVVPGTTSIMAVVARGVVTPVDEMYDVREFCTVSIPEENASRPRKDEDLVAKKK